jgi:hypothetical protein
MDLDAIRHAHSAPCRDGVVVGCGDDVGLGGEGGLEGAGDAPFEGVAGDPLHFGFDRFE